jgi:hypothetical protein
MLSRRVITAKDVITLQTRYGGGAIERPRPGQGRLLAPAPGGSVQSIGSDEYSAKLLKLIPAEAITVFVAIENVMQAKPDLASHGIYWVIALLLLGGSYVYSFRQALVPGLTYPHRQALITMAAFMVWMFAIGGPFKLSLGNAWSPLYGTIILPLFTFLVPLLTEPRTDK